METVTGNKLVVVAFTKPSAKATILYSHGNATDVGAMYDRYADISDTLGVNVVAYDYSGYGRSTGAPTEMTTYDDITAAYHWARQQYPDTVVVLYGQSGKLQICASVAATSCRFVWRLRLIWLLVVAVLWHHDSGQRTELLFGEQADGRRPDFAQVCVCVLNSSAVAFWPLLTDVCVRLDETQPHHVGIASAHIEPVRCPFHPQLDNARC